MVKTRISISHRKGGWLSVDLWVAVALLLIALIPLAHSYLEEQRLLRALYYRALAMEIVDGELEILAAGEWRVFSEGKQVYPVELEAADDLPPGKFIFSRKDDHLRLEWVPDGPRGHGGPIVREIDLNENLKSSP